LNISHKYEEAVKDFKGFGININGIDVEWSNV